MNVRETLWVFIMFSAMAAVSCRDTVTSRGTAPESGAFPGDFLWGVSTSAYQTEGNNSLCDYDVWNRAGHGEDLNGMAANSYQLFDVDSELARATGVACFRIGIEWSRIEPERDMFDPREIAHYRNVIESITSRGMKPFVTLHHFTNPLWVAESGSWLNPQVVEEFAHYAGKMALVYGDLVDEWITINEPVIYATGTYWGNLYPGGSILNMGEAKAALRNMIRAHAAAYDAIRERDHWDADGDGRPCRTACVSALSPVYPARPDSPDDIGAAERFDQFFHRQIYDALVYGRLLPYLEPEDGIASAEAAHGWYHPELANRVDYIGINYYSPQYVRYVPFLLCPLEAAPCYAPIESLCFPEGRPDVVRGDNGNEVYPHGLFEILENYASYGLPLIVTENGIATADSLKRAWFTVEHIEQVEKALRKGYRVEGYFHWSLIDNFEWLSGYSMRFGLYRMDFTTFERIRTTAVDAYREVIMSGRITETIKKKYAWP